MAAQYFPAMATKLAANRITERKLRDKRARRAQIISAARRIAELEAWSNVTVRRLFSFQICFQSKHFSMTGSQGWGVGIVSENMAREGRVLHLKGAAEIETWSRPSNPYEGYMIVHADEADYHIDTGHRTARQRPSGTTRPIAPRSLRRSG